MRPIDADGLIKVLQGYKQTQYNDDRPDLDYEYIDIDDLNYVIDNAPTVEPEEVYMNGKDYDIYLEGYKQGKKDFERPQGEWIIVKEERMSVDMSGEIVTRYKCSKCGRPITILPSKLADYPFCHCGAKMKGGAE